MSSENAYFMKQPCNKCPFRMDVKPFLRPAFGHELAEHATNVFGSFHCHKTTVSSEDGNNRECDENTKECAGFITFQINEGIPGPDGFTPSPLVYSNHYDMIDAYRNQ